MIYINNGDSPRTRRAIGNHEIVCIKYVLNIAQHNPRNKIEKKITIINGRPYKGAVY